jgi:hypothetical protein
VQLRDSPPSQDFADPLMLGQEHHMATEALGQPSDDGRPHILASDTTSTHESGFPHGRSATSEIAAFITSQALITVREDDGPDTGAVVERRNESPASRS